MILHTVTPGETLTAVASRYGVPVRNLAADNGVTVPEQLPVGMVLLVAEPLSTHTVTAGETLYAVAKRYGVSLRTLWRNNLFLQGASDLREGDVLYLDVKADRIKRFYQCGGAAVYIRHGKNCYFPFFSFHNVK